MAHTNGDPYTRTNCLWEKHPPQLFLVCDYLHVHLPIINSIQRAKASPWRGLELVRMIRYKEYPYLPKVADNNNDHGLPAD